MNQKLKKSLIGTTLITLFLMGFELGAIFASPSGSRSIYLDDIPSTAKYVIYSDGSTYWAVRDDGKIPSGMSGSSFTSVVQAAMDGLTSGRTWKEMVYVRPRVLTVDYNTAEIEIPNYTILDFGHSTVKVANGVEYVEDKACIKNKVASPTDIEIRNLIFDENAAGAPDGWAYMMHFVDASNVKIVDCDLQSPSIDCEIYFEGTGSNIKFLHNTFKVTTSIETDTTEFAYNTMLSGKTVSLSGDNVKVGLNLFYGQLIISGAHTLISQNTFYNAVLTAASTSHYLVVTQNSFEHTSATIAMNLKGNDVVVSANSLKGTRGAGTESHGIHLDTGGNNCSITNNKIADYDVGVIWDYGKYTQISSNHIKHANRGIWIGSSGTSYGTVENNYLLDCTTAFYIENLADYNRFERNTVQSCTTVLDDSATGTIVKYNIGYATENRGTATITTSTTVVVNHGLVATPTIVTVTLGTTGAGDYYVDTLTSTQFTVHVANSGTYTLYWYAEV